MDSFIHSKYIECYPRARGPLLVCNCIHLQYASAPGANITYVLLTKLSG